MGAWRWADFGVRDRGMRDSGGGDRAEARGLACAGGNEGRVARHRLGARRADTDARGGDARVHRRDRPRGGRLMGVETITLGCRLNFAESEMMRGLAGTDDLTIVNSCAVTHEAVRQ